MTHYNLLPVDGLWFDNQELKDACGSLFPFITTKTGAIKYAKSVKKRFPDVTFGLFEGETFGSQKLVQEF